MLRQREQEYNAVFPGTAFPPPTRQKLTAFPGKPMKGTISRQSDNVATRYRNENIEIDVPNEDSRMSPGMYADVPVDAPGDTRGLFVPQSALVATTGGQYVLNWKQGHIRKTDVTTGNATGDSVQVYGDLRERGQVIARRTRT